MLKSDKVESGSQQKDPYNSDNYNISEPSDHTNQQQNSTTLASATLTYHPTAVVAPNPAKKHKTQFHMHSKINIIPEAKREELNIQFLVTLPGVLKLVEVSLGFIAFILSLCADRRSTTAAWTDHITFETTVVVSALLLGYVIFPHLTIADEKTRRGLIVLELIFYGINTLFYFISIWLMVHLSVSWLSESKGAAIMSAIVCVALCVIFAFETLTKFRVWTEADSATMKSSNKRNNISIVPTYPPPASQQQASSQLNTTPEHHNSYPPTIELNPDREHSDV